MMNSIDRNRSPFSPRALKMGMVALLLGGLAGCQTTNPGNVSSREFEAFTPLPLQKRYADKMSVRWDLRSDVAQFCARSTGMNREQAKLTPPLACAVWQAGQKECLIVTGYSTTHVALGHEFRHCFEGHFHE